MKQAAQLVLKQAGAVVTRKTATPASQGPQRTGHLRHWESRGPKYTRPRVTLLVAFPSTVLTSYNLLVFGKKMFRTSEHEKQIVAHDA